MPSLVSPFIEISYELHGDPNGIPVMLLHGFPDSAASWNGLMAAWKGRPVRWVVPALRGFGATRVTDPEGVTGQVAALADDLLLIQDALGLERAVWVGHDWGARAVYAAAALHPDRVRAVLGLASEYVAYRDTGELPHEQERAYWYQWFFHTPQGERSLTRDRAGLCRCLWQVWSPASHFSEQDFVEAARAWDNPQFVATVLSYYRTRHGNAPGTARYVAAQAHLAAKPRLIPPTWFITGLADACNDAASSLGQEAWFAGPYERITLPGVGHFPHREAPEAVADVLARAIAQTEEGIHGPHRIA